jgi:hypothetical protein
MALTLDLQKSAQSLVLSLEKKGIATPPSIDLAFNLDVSGSFDDEHRAGITNTLLTRLVPWAMVFDPDRKLEVFTFSDGRQSAHYVGDVRPDNCEDFVAKHIINRVPGYYGGTDYSYVLDKNLEHFGWTGNAGQGQQSPANQASKPSLFGRLSSMFGGQAPAPAPSVTPATPAATTAPTPGQKRTIIIHVTDGQNSDTQKTLATLSASEKRKDGVYFLFLGVSQQNTKFPFIHELGERFSNVGFVAVNQVAQWVAQSDEVINQALLNDELINWLKAG